MRRYRRILFGTDFSELAEIGQTAAVELAKRVGAEELHVVHVAPSPGLLAYSPEVLLGEERISTLKDRVLARVQEELELLHISISSTKVVRTGRIGHPVRELCQAADEIAADLIVVASHGRSEIGKLMMGSVASELVRASPCPLLVVGKDREANGAFRSIIAAVDLSPVSSEVLDHSFSLASVDRAHLMVLSIFEAARLAKTETLPRYLDPADLGVLAERYEAAVRRTVAARSFSGIEAELHVESHESPAREMIDRINERSPDLLVIGSSGHSAWHRMMIGSTTQAVIRSAQCPVLVVPNPAAVDSIPAPVPT